MLGFGLYVITNQGYKKDILQIGGHKKRFTLQKRLKNIKLIICDVDGVLTDGKMIYSENGDELKNFNTRDGIAAKQLKDAGYMLAIISSGKCINLIKRRGTFLRYDAIVVTDKNKVLVLDDMLKDMKLQYEQTLYIGDDVNDYEAMRKCLVACCPADACARIKNGAHIILNACGGNGCLREVAEMLLGG
jgi:YrbI family 3-deoxy-D-manno-octulosonate 8-phosphate phosphatase